MSRIVLSVPLDALRDQCLDIPLKDTSKNYHIDSEINHGALPCKYRLIDCIQYTHHETLVIYEFDDLPPEQYSAISYIWRGKPADPGSHPQESRGTFSVRGAEDGDPMSMDVLFHACTASLQKNARYLWVDRLCILQKCATDKAWQIRKMYGIYKGCDPCLILPGGIRHLVGIEEETVWIQRAWTLQEVMAPDNALVLFQWRHGAGWFHGPVASGDLELVIRGESAVADVMDLCLPYLSGVMGGYTYFVQDDDEDEDEQAEQVRIKIEPIIFGRDRSHVLALLGIMWGRDPDAVPQAIWRSALMRVSSRPVDMVFSIMGLFDVSLDPRAFQSGDRFAATVALAQEILRKGGNASWLVASLHAPPERQLSTFPMFPETTVDGKARIRVSGELKEMTEIVEDEFLRIWSVKEGTLGGSMDDMGYLTLSSKAVEVQPVPLNDRVEKEHCRCSTANSKRVFMKALDNSVWEACLEKSDSCHRPAPQTLTTRTFAVYMGMALTNPYASQPTLQRYIETYTMLAVVIQEQSPNKFHRISNMILCHCFEEFIKTWEVHEVCIGPDTSVRAPGP
ncbi:het-domain-containing protein [Moniliophthora roreri MCA 2997]|uniref:Het-domain-containing protein n=2 Tax=Moniliophthora roreri TaxID=221103 RepID=V2YFF8_MONRO|nr:het-domain-containing protein [Moniliophthora roreri MCA 2997]